ncbi:MAG: hypothetical protein QOF69_1838 [Solirubrobacteraceae bacterium]|nr:hypothetical protein [Solirubrobacteraceae bacterium]
MDADQPRLDGVAGALNGEKRVAFTIEISQADLRDRATVDTFDELRDCEQVATR